jgi:hypothetical protein
VGSCEHGNEPSDSKTGRKFLGQLNDSVIQERICSIVFLIQCPTFLEASRDIGLEINAEKTKYMIMSRYPNS